MDHLTEIEDVTQLTDQQIKEWALYHIFIVEAFSEVAEELPKHLLHPQEGAIMKEALNRGISPRLEVIGAISYTTELLRIIEDSWEHLDNEDTL